MRQTRLLLSGMLLLLSSAAFADTSVSARVSAADISMGENVLLTVEIIDGSRIDSQPALNLSDFQSVAAERSESSQWLNGKTTSMVAYNFVLSPLKTGALTIPSVQVGVDGKTFQTQPLTVNVRQNAASQRPAADTKGGIDVPAEGLRPLFMTAKVDTDRAYVGQQILLKIQIVSRPDLEFTSQFQFSQPNFTGFIVEPLKQVKYSAPINGVNYDIFELPYALFPTSDGEFAIGSAQAEVAVRAQVNAMDPNSFFQNFFGRSQVARLNTRAIPVRVRALPKNKPAEFSGAVGRFKLSGKVDTKDVEVGKPVNLVLTVTGVGNVKSLKEPFLPAPKGFRRYETISSSKMDEDSRFLHGTKEFKILLIPQVSGALTIPAAQFSYFDPVADDYVTDTAPEITINVKAGAANADSFQERPEPTQTVTEGIRVMERDIRFIKQAPVVPVSQPLYFNGWFILLNAIPPFFALAALLLRRQRARRIERADEYRSRSALRIARRELVGARKALANPDPAVFYGFIQKSITGFVADKIGAAAAGLTRESIDAALGAGRVDDTTRALVRDLLDRADMARFAASSLESDDRPAALAQAETALKAMGKTL